MEPLRCNADNIGAAIQYIVSRFEELAFDYIQWENSEYLPTPTIVEAAQALYRGHNVHDITRSDAGAENLTVTTDEINHIIPDGSDTDGTRKREWYDRTYEYLCDVGITHLNT